MEEEGRDDKVKPGHLRVCHFHLNQSPHWFQEEGSGRGEHIGTE